MHRDIHTKQVLLVLKKNASSPAPFLKRPIHFLDAPSHLYKRVCPSVRRSVTPSLRRVLGASYAEYSALFFISNPFLISDSASACLVGTRFSASSILSVLLKEIYCTIYIPYHCTICIVLYIVLYVWYYIYSLYYNNNDG